MYRLILSSFFRFASIRSLFTSFEALRVRFLAAVILVGKVKGIEDDRSIIYFGDVVVSLDVFPRKLSHHEPPLDSTVTTVSPLLIDDMLSVIESSMLQGRRTLTSRKMPNFCDFPLQISPCKTFYCTSTTMCATCVLSVSDTVDATAAML